MKIIRALFCLLMLLALVSCASSPSTPQVVPDEPAVHHFSGNTEDVFHGNNLTVADRLIPWNVNAAQKAKDTKELYFYFMASEGTPVPGVSEKIGDSCLVAFPNGELMLIDANQDAYVPQLVANLKALGVTHLDYVLITHPHSDHYMGMLNSDGLVQNFTIGKLIYNGTENAGHTKIKEVSDKAGIPVEIWKEGETYTFGEVSVKVINPTATASASKVSATRETNDSSITMIVTYGTIKSMFTGDMYDTGLNELVDRYGTDLDVDFLKIPHHGHSETSLSSKFAKAISADLALASSGVALNASVYGLYASNGTTVLGDYTEGYIVVHTDGTKLMYETSRERKTDYYNKLFDTSWKPTAISSANVSSYATGTFTVVSNENELLKAISDGKKNIRLGADIDVRTHASTEPLKLDLTGVVLDMDGHFFKGVSSVVTDIANKGQSARCNLQINGRDFAILNGSFSKAVAGGYALQINLGETNPEANKNIVIDGVTIANGGIDVRGSYITLRNCKFIQPLENTQNFTTIMMTDSFGAIESGSYYNKSNYSYKRWLKLYNAKAYVKNGVDWDGTVLYSVEDSMLILEK